MKVALLYTSHRQFPELALAARLAARRRQPVLRDVGHVLFHCNNAAIPEADVRAAVEVLPYRSTKLLYRPQHNRGGYPYGQFEAILDAWDDVMAGGFDAVVHLHPDVFVADEDKLLAAAVAPLLERAGGAPVALVAKTFGHRHPSFATDFFAFRPHPGLRAVFESYLPLLATDVVVPLENLFFVELLRTGLPHRVIPRFAHGHYHRDVDLLGLWHEHNLARVAAYAGGRPGRRWRTTAARAARRPYAAARVAATYAGRWWAGKPQDSLAKQLTTL